jgi:uncharacterized protein (TIGR03066 family)
MMRMKRKLMMAALPALILAILVAACSQPTGGGGGDGTPNTNTSTGNIIGKWIAVEEEYGDSVLTFTANGKYTVDMDSMGTAEGTYSLSGNTLTTKATSATGPAVAGIGATIISTLEWIDADTFKKTEWGDLTQTWKRIK